MLDPHVSRFWQATLLSGLMDAQALTACWEAIAPAKREDLEHLDRRLARQAVQLKALTLWQAQQLLAGRTSGFKVDRYVLLDLIGQGGMGRVYLARDTRLNREVALKILSPERVSNPRAIARFQREARVGAQLQHENLVRIYDFGESNNRYYLVMEYIEGKTIGTLISEQGKIPSTTAVRLVRQVALGLEHAHRKGLIHRDVNPYNVLVTRDGTAKLADLGLAIDLADDDHVTREGATVGTFDYVAPEQARHSHSADIRSDIYSLGCTIYHMCAGQVPFPSPSLPEKLFAHQALEPTLLYQLVPGLPEGLSEVVQRMMRKSPDERFATPMQVVQALEPYADTPSSSGMREVSGSTVQELVAEHSSGPTQFESLATRALTQPQLRAEPAPALVKTIAALDGLETPPDPATQTGSGGNVDGTTAPLHSPSPEEAASAPDFPLTLDFGPEPLLSDGLSRPKPRSAVDHLVSVASAAIPTGRPGASWLWGLVALTTMVLALAAFLALVKPFDANRLSTTVGSHVAHDPKVKPKGKTAPSTTIPKGESAIIVRSNGDDVQAFPVQKLHEAMQTAIGTRGWVELQNREPIHLTSDQTFDFNSGSGRLMIRAAPGTQPVIEVERRGPEPLLTTGAGVTLNLSGLTIKADYPEQGPYSTPPVVIMAAGSAKIDRCAIQVTGISHLKGSRAIVSNGGVLEVNRCWFQGFDETINIIAANRASSRIRQTMIVPASGPTLTQAHDFGQYGWGVKVQLDTRGGAQMKNVQPHLILEHCTVEAAGLIDLTASAGSMPLEVDISYCAVKATALLACNPEPTPSTQVRWQGKGNQYDILGPGWIILSAKEGTPAFLSTVTELQSWSHFAPGDQDLVQDKLRFLSDAAERARSVQPVSYKIQTPAGLQIKPGADPEKVGPWSNP
jgi:eukaryotic-like serine/threonine-protein kinase